MTNFLQLAITGLLTGGLYAMVGAAIVLVYKSTHVVSLAHGQFLAFGAFFFYIFISVLDLPFLAAILLTFLVAALYGDSPEYAVEAEITYRDGRKGVIKTEIHINRLDS
jgi:branched-chain amino acid transport system permease protein